MSNPFGNPPSSTGGSSLFGQQSNNNNGTSANTTQQSGGTSGLFGGASKPVFGSAFGQQNQGTGPSQPLFGSSQSAPATTSGFGFKKPEEKKDQGNNGGSNLFGGFSTPNKSDNNNQNQPQGLFGGQTSSQPSGSATPTTSKPAFGSGVSTTPAGPPPTSLFGNLSQPQKNNAPLFGSSAQPISAQSSEQSSQNPAPSLFGGQPSQSTASPFASAAGASSSPSIFGKPSENAPAPATTEAPKFSFANATSSQPENTQSAPASKPSFGFPSSGNNTAQAQSAPVSKPSFGFPSSGNNTTQNSGPATPSAASNDKPSLFGAPSDKTGSSNMFGNMSKDKEGQQTRPTSQNGDGQATASSASSLFGNVSQKKDDQPAPAASLFGRVDQSKEKEGDASQKDAAKPSTASNPFASFGQSKTTNADDGAKTQAPATTTASGAAGAAAPSASLFGASMNKPAQATTPKPTDPASSSNPLGASTAGPTPAAPSRLKNKSMDEIITRWASDLTKYQKDFQAQAEKVAAWDRMLLENGNAVSKLYSKTFQAERDTAEVQKQLSNVESHQDELSHWLDRYEREVDEMMARQLGQGDGLQGPDQERERTWVSTFHREKTPLIFPQIQNCFTRFGALGRDGQRLDQYDRRDQRCFDHD